MKRNFPKVTTEKKVFRKSNIELLRILAMFLIVAHHYAYHAGFELSGKELNINRFWIFLLLSGGKISVDIFVLISGYFLVSAKQLNISKVIKIWGQLLFYSLIIFVVFVLAGTESFGIKKMILCLIPVTNATWWFASTYFVLYLLSPYINILLLALEKKQYIVFLASLFFYWCIIPTFTGRPFECNSLLWFVFLYSLAGYVKLFGMSIPLSSGKLIALSFSVILLSVILVVCFYSLPPEIPSPEYKKVFIQKMNSLPILIISFLLFVGFSKMDIGYNKFINIIASATFGVYLIHDHLLVRQFLWITLFKNASYLESNILILHSLLAIFIVFTCCTIIELLRISIVEKKYMPVINRIADLIPRLLNKTIMWIQVFEQNRRH